MRVYTKFNTILSAECTICEELRTGLQEFFTGADIEIREKGGRFTAASPLFWEVRGAESKPLLHLWGRELQCDPQTAGHCG